MALPRLLTSVDKPKFQPLIKKGEILNQLSCGIRVNRDYLVMVSEILPIWGRWTAGRKRAHEKTRITAGSFFA